MAIDAEQPAAQGSGQGQDPGEFARGFLERLLEAMDLEGTVQVSQPEAESYRLEVAGPEIASIIGRQGNTLSALQYLLMLIVQRQTGERVRIVVDAGGYRSRREEVLRDTALSLAERVKESGEECVLDPMSGFDRRIIHTALADHPDVVTYSEGDEPERCVVISPRSAQDDEEGDQGDEGDVEEGGQGSEE